MRWPFASRLLPLPLLAVVACTGGKADTDTDTATGTTTETSGSTGVPDDPCMQTPDPGNCDAAFEKWAFDPASQRCYAFTYGGCDGVVPFDDLETCRSSCEPCDAYFDGMTPAPSADAVPITIRNESANPIWIQAYAPSGDALGYREQVVEILPTQDEPLITAPNWCDFGCGAFDNDQCAAGCSDGGPPPPPIYLEAGGTYTTSWAGQHFPAVQLPERCTPSACADGVSCHRWENAEYGEYTARITIALSIDCVDPGCTCAPNGEGWCAIEATDAVLKTPADVSASVLWPGANVDLVVNP
ncbi:MAG: BPTI/Kunitz-type proteinase inhibitor domain-containing protein [Nannocystaceae bacterium]